MKLSRLLRPTLALTAASGLLLTAGCAIGNSGKLVLSRHISVGQELIDLQRARDEGAITEEEYELIKGKLMQMVEQIEIVDTVNDSTPDSMHTRHED